MRHTIIALMLLSGCPSSDACERPLHHVELRVLGQPSLVAYLSSDSEWITPTRSDDGTYGMCAGEITRVVVGCEDEDGTFQVFERSSTFLEEAEIVSGCSNAFTSPPDEADLVVIDGTMKQAGRVHIGSTRLVSLIGGWTFEFTRFSGIQDLIASDAFDAPGRVAVRRDLDAREDLSLGEIDLEIEGVPTEIANVSIGSPLKGEQYDVSTSLHTGRTEATFSEVDGLAANVIPAAALHATDQQGLYVHGVSAAGPRRLSRSASLSEVRTTVELLAPPEGVEFGDATMSATWDEIPANYTEVSLFLVSNGGSSIHTSVTRGAIELGIELSVDTSAPDYRSRWHIDSSNGVSFRTLTVSADEPLESRSISISE